MTKGLVRNEGGWGTKRKFGQFYTLANSAIDSRADPPNEHYVIWNLCSRVWRNCAVGPSDRRAAAAEVRGLFRGCFGRWPPSKRLEKFGKQRGAAALAAGAAPRVGPISAKLPRPPNLSQPRPHRRSVGSRPPSHQLIVKQLSCCAAA